MNWPWISPTILTGAANSNNIGWDIKILLAFAQIKRISEFDRINDLGFFFCKPEATNLSMIESTFKFWGEVEEEDDSDDDVFDGDDDDDEDDNDKDLLVGGGCFIFKLIESFGGFIWQVDVILFELFSNSKLKWISFEFVEEGEVEGEGVETEEDETKENELLSSLIE